MMRRYSRCNNSSTVLKRETMLCSCAIRRLHIGQNRGFLPGKPRLTDYPGTRRRSTPAHVDPALRNEKGLLFGKRKTAA